MNVDHVVDKVFLEVEALVAVGAGVFFGGVEGI